MRSPKAVVVEDEKKEEQVVAEASVVDDSPPIHMCVSRNPRKLYLAIRKMNENSDGFFPMVDDYEKDREVMLLCLLFSEKKLTFHDFWWHVVNLDLFDLGKMSIFMEGYRLAEHDGSSKIAYPKEALKAMAARPGWKTFFKKPKKE